MQRLDKILSEAGVASRKELKSLIRAGRVTVDGAVVREEAKKFDEAACTIAVDGAAVEKYRKVLLMLHKPAGVISATQDAKEKTVLDLLPKDLRRKDLFPVGRLDKDTEGLLLLTNDGALAHALLAPGRHVDKVYYTKVDGDLEEDDVAAFAEGITLGDGTACLPAGLDLISEREALVTLREGKYHQVKRMLAARGKPVVYLKRLSMGPIALDPALAPGEWRPLTGEEKALLRRGTAGDPGFSAF